MSHLLLYKFYFGRHVGPLRRSYFKKTLRSSVSLILDDCTINIYSINCRVVYDGAIINYLFLRSMYENALDD